VVHRHQQSVKLQTEKLLLKWSNRGGQVRKTKRHINAASYSCSTSTQLFVELNNVSMFITDWDAFSKTSPAGNLGILK